ncbi:hypothetical protein [Psychroserpens sp. SPM9]|uniref:hypothetical protein n=1 Tax=Psychroserpens sp. SPM9 TaxID=2975598 RepID=UPI0021A3F3D6|nr:hypothetical protein [Psychroserpens sp. SPM9]MDG5491267.1 hypothetical protein [Psychroserpens sp. SPM9]
MKNLFFAAFFLGFCFVATAQNEPKVGDVLEISEPYAQSFNHINFPKQNILIKRGKVANYNSVYGNKVVVEAIKTKDDGTTYVILKKQDGSKFFNYLTTVKANYQKAIDAGELSK